MDIGIMRGQRVGNEKLFQRLRVVGIIVNQGFDQKAVFKLVVRHVPKK